MRWPLTLALLVAVSNTSGVAQSSASTTSRDQTWQHGPPADANFFPIAVWLQNPQNAERYKAAGINTYVGLWRGPTEPQLEALENAGMKLICAQNAFALGEKDSPTIIGWMHGDEPDNAQSLGSGKGYGPPIAPTTIVQNYERIRTNDPTRPVLLNLGQGVAWDNYIGRGVRRNHPEDYPEYVKGCDIASFDIYPAVHSDKEIAGKLEFVARGVQRLTDWTAGKKVVWNCIECTRISNVERKPTPAEVKTEVWMSLIHGSQGLIYFVHQFKPTFREAALLDDSEMLAAVTRLNGQIRELAVVLNSPTLAGHCEITSSNNEVPIAAMLKKQAGSLYLFAVAMRPQPTRASISIKDLSGAGKVEVIEEGRSISVQDGKFADEFAAYAVHLYRITASK